jgi:hydroxymethylpyrimidine pyrophosphatase-like HAD family hydrolase
LNAGLEAFATDLDGTLTSRGEPLSERISGALRDASRRGLRLVLVTGRCLEEVDRMVPPDIFDATVAENGALLRLGGETRSFAPPGWDETRKKLLSRLAGGCERVIISAESGLGAIAEQLAGEESVELSYNKDRVMIVPSGIDKGTGLREALLGLSILPKACACVGDGENDLSMFRLSGYRIALSDSVDALKEIADTTTSGGAGEGVVEALESIRRLNGHPGEVMR